MEAKRGGSGNPLSGGSLWEEVLEEGLADHRGGHKRGCVYRCISYPKPPSSAPLEWEFLSSLRPTLGRAYAQEKVFSCLT